MIAQSSWEHCPAEKMSAAAIMRKTVRPAGEAKP